MELFYIGKKADHSTKFGLPCAKQFKHTNKNNIFIIVNTLLIQKQTPLQLIANIAGTFNQTEVKYIVKLI